MESLSPCAKPECRGKNKTECSSTCPELARYQQYLAMVEDRFSPPGIDYTDYDRFNIDAGKTPVESEKDAF